MLGKQHVQSGVVGGLCVLAVGAHGLGIARPTDLLLFPIIAGGAALLPDIDHHSSSVTRSFPVLTKPLHWLCVWAHRLMYLATRRGTDLPARTAVGWRSAHRGITHSLIAAVIVTLLLMWAMYVTPWWVTVVVIAMFIMLASDLIYAPVVAGAYALAGLHELGANDLASYVHAMAWFWSLAIGVGMICHDLGDCATTDGVALLSPLSWKPMGPPLRFKTGSWVETTLVKYGLVGLTLYLSFVVHAGWVLALIDARR